MNEDFLKDKNILFVAKAEPVPYNYRTSYKVAQICLILSLTTARGGCSLFKVHMFAMALCTRKGMELLKSYANKQLPKYTAVRLDPVVNRAINYAVFDGLVTQQGDGKFKLTEVGKEFVKAIEETKEIMKNEINYLKEIGTKISEERIRQLVSTWRYSNAEN